MASQPHIAAGQRIALVVHGWPPSRCTGVEVHAQALARALADAGAAVEVLCADEGDDATHASCTRLVEDGIGVSRLRLRRPGDAEAALEPAGVEQAVEAWLQAAAPTTVLFEHSILLGIGALRAAAKLGVPVVHRAHDHWLVSPQYLAVRPDLVPFVPNDSAMLARIDLVRAKIEHAPRGLGGTLAPESAPAALLASMRAILDGDADELRAAGVDPVSYRAAVETRRALERRRRESLRAVDLVLAPTATLAATLRRAGLPAPLSTLACGIEDRGLRALEPAGRHGPLRVGFIGTLAPHKGLDTLLDALAGQSGFELRVHGVDDDARRMEAVRARVVASGGVFRGGYAPREIAAVLRDIDVLVFPSRWPEVAPFTLLEARAARRAIVASDIGGVRELVQHGREALLVAPGDVAELRAALLRLRDEPGLVERLALEAPPPPSVADEASALLERFAALGAEREARRAARALPASVASFETRVQKLAAMPAGELAARVAEGLAKARKAFLGEERAPLAILASLRAAAAPSDELESLAAENASLRAANAALGAERDWRASVEAGLRDEAAALRAEADWRRRDLEAAQGEAAWRAKELESALARASGLEARLADSPDPAEVQALRAACAAHKAELEWRATVEADLRAEVEWRRSSDGARDAALADTRAALQDAHARHAAECEAHAATRAAQAATTAALAAVEAEARWRAEQMESVRESLSRARFALVGRGLKERVDQWPRRAAPAAPREGGAS